ncbi:MAG: hypothetical protein AMXMBFR33_03200 [Candidatus Xenobia bacterium]
MCGIAGILYDATGQAVMDWKGYRAALEELTHLAVDPFQPQTFEAPLLALEEHTPILREFSVLRELLEDANHQALLAECSQTLGDWEVRSQTLVLQQGKQISTEVVERWNALWVRARDLAWTAERDILAGIERLRRLIPAAYQHNSKAQFEAWKLSCVLENIGRLEVRGRDSLGLSILATFSEREGLQRFHEWIEQEGRQAEWRSRLGQADFVDGAVLEEPNALIFTFKVAQEVGALGDNVAALAHSILEDRFFWRVLSDPDVRTNLFSHTRWASNGIISEPNCHPVNELTVPSGCDREQPREGSPRILAALNGDVDNHIELQARLARESGRTISAPITTDTKIIPVLVESYFRETGNMREAFCRAMQECEGSIAVVMHSTHEPDRTYLALRGSGQSMFVGIGPHGYTFASELYGVVEQTSRFLRMDGTTEREAGRPETAGQILVLDAKKLHELEGIEAWSFDGHRLELTPEQIKVAEITTRDINRGPFEHFLLKEISESPESVRKTLRGKFVLEENPPAVTMRLGEDVFPATLAERLKQRELKHVLLIGQGTAAVAGQAVASMMQRVVGSSVDVRAMKATELSGYSMLADMTSCLVIAISQSGTTTDTNRTVDLVKSKGASVLAIVNRRNSDLVYKVDGVLYTSDGRDIEMSVASTKAFYSQVVAGYLLAYQMGILMGTLGQEEAFHELESLLQLPDLMKSVLADHSVVSQLAEAWAPTRRDWAVVGSGSTRAAADEIRIKLSELCYKSIATDYIEDKKHIDLSSEPLTLICAAGLPLVALKDAVKEVAIFKSHKSVPIVICSEGFDAFESYAAGVIYVPKASENASVLLNTLVGHLWGYYCALAIDQGAAQLRPARALAVKYMTTRPDSSPGSAVWRQVITLGRQFQERLSRGAFNSSLSVDVGARLSLLFRYFTGAQPLRQFRAEFDAPGTSEGMAATLIANLTTAINELARPIDAIKHQAKTITVGISRSEETLVGPLFDGLRDLKVSLESIPYRDLMLLRAISPAISEVVGVTEYRVSGLGPMGEPTATSSLQVLTKLGAARNLRSRADHPHHLMGTKEKVVRTRAGYIGRGGKDLKPIVILPVIPRGKVETLVLFHLEFQELPLARKVALLRDMAQRYDDLKSFVTETDMEWHDSYLEELSVSELVTLPTEALNARVLEVARNAVAATA